MDPNYNSGMTTPPRYRPTFEPLPPSTPIKSVERHGVHKSHHHHHPQARTYNPDGPIHDALARRGPFSFSSGARNCETPPPSRPQASALRGTQPAHYPLFGGGPQAPPVTPAVKQMRDEDELPATLPPNVRVNLFNAEPTQPADLRVDVPNGIVTPQQTPPLGYAVPNISPFNANPFSPYHQRRSLNAPATTIVDVITTNHHSHMPSSVGSIDASRALHLHPNMMDVVSEGESESGAPNHDHTQTPELDHVRQDQSGTPQPGGTIIDDSDDDDVSSEVMCTPDYQTEFSVPWTSDMTGVPVHRDVNGTVWLIKSALDGQPYFLKEVQCDNAALHVEDMRVELHGMTLGEDCDNITVLHSVWTSRTNSVVYVQFECCPGGTLPQYLDRTDKSERLVVDCLVQALTGLATLHSAHIVHGNAHIHNCFVSPVLLSCDHEVGVIIKIGNLGNAVNTRATPQHGSATPSDDVRRLFVSLREHLGEETLATYTIDVREVFERATSSIPFPAPEALRALRACRPECLMVRRAMETELELTRPVPTRDVSACDSHATSRSLSPSGSPRYADTTPTASLTATFASSIGGLSGHHNYLSAPQHHRTGSSSSMGTNTQTPSQFPFRKRELDYVLSKADEIIAQLPPKAHHAVSTNSFCGSFVSPGSRTHSRGATPRHGTTPSASARSPATQSFGGSGRIAFTTTSQRSTFSSSWPTTTTGLMGGSGALGGGPIAGITTSGSNNNMNMAPSSAAEGVPCLATLDANQKFISV
eukprot:PhM_4_TR11061/c0_g1_i1/m.22076